MPIELRSWIPPSATWPDVTVTAAARAVATLDRVSAGRAGVHLILGSRGRDTAARHAA